MSSASEHPPFFGGGRRPLGTGSLGMSILIHVLALVAVFWVVPALQPEQIIYRVIELELMSPPPVQAPPPDVEEPPAAEDELVVETPDEPEPPAVEEEDPLPLLEDKQPEPEPEPEPDTADTKEPEPEPEETPPPDETPVPAETDEEEEEEERLSFEQLQVRQEGFKAEHPEYFANILRQIERCLRTTDDRVATVQFEIERDGRTTGFDVVRSSGRTTFDWQALEAIECAGKQNRLGPLPEDYPFDVLPIILELRPRGGEFDPSGEEGERRWKPQCAH